MIDPKENSPRTKKFLQKVQLIKKIELNKIS
jgi:hypothetical protein